MLNSPSQYPLTRIQTTFNRLDTLHRNTTFGSKSVCNVLYVVHTGTLSHDFGAETHFNLGMGVILFRVPGGMYVLSGFGGYDEEIGGGCEVDGFLVLWTTAALSFGSWCLAVIVVIFERGSVGLG